MQGTNTAPKPFATAAINTCATHHEPPIDAHQFWLNLVANSLQSSDPCAGLKSVTLVSRGSPDAVAGRLAARTSYCPKAQGLHLLPTYLP